MATIKALRWPGVILPSGYRLAEGETLTTDNETLRQTDTARVIPALIAAGDIEVAYDPDPEPESAEAPPAPSEPAPTETPVEPVAEAPARKK